MFDEIKEAQIKEALQSSIQYSYNGGDVKVREDGTVLYTNESGRTVATSLDNLGLSDVSTVNVSSNAIGEAQIKEALQNSIQYSYNGGDIKVREDGTVLYTNKSGRTVATSLDNLGLSDVSTGVKDNVNFTTETNSNNSGNSGGDTIVSGERNPQAGGNTNTSFTSQPLTYTTKRGDSIASIASATGISYSYLLNQYTNQWNGGVQQSDLANHTIYANQNIDLNINTEEIMKSVNSINSVIGQLSSLNTKVCGHISDLWNSGAFQIGNLKSAFEEYIANTSKSSNTVVSDLGSMISWLNRVVKSCNVENVSISAEKYTADFAQVNSLLNENRNFAVNFDVDNARSCVSKIKGLQSDYDALKQSWENTKTNLRSYGWAGNNSNAFYVNADEVTSELGLLSDNIEMLYSQINTAIDSYESMMSSLDI